MNWIWYFNFLNADLDKVNCALQHAVQITIIIFWNVICDIHTIVFSVPARYINVGIFINKFTIKFDRDILGGTLSSDDRSFIHLCYYESACASQCASASVSVYRKCHDIYDAVILAVLAATSHTSLSVDPGRPQTVELPCVTQSQTVARFPQSIAFAQFLCTFLKFHLNNKLITVRELLEWV